MPGDWGWEMCDGQWKVVWTTLLEAAKAFTTNCSVASARRPARGTASVKGHGGHIEIQDGGHQGAFQSWVLIEN